MKLAEYGKMDATEISQLIASGALKSEEVHELAIEAINAVNKHVNALADGPWNRPLTYEKDGAFSGVPFVVKDAILQPEGVPVTSGSRLSGHGLVADHDAELMKRFRAAGLATIGVSTCPELAFSPNTESVRYGSTKNPWDLTRSAGGSSGGTAALVASGAVPMGHANDGGGSIRIPAAHCGLVGLLPTRGRVPLGPDIQEAVWGSAREFAITRTVRDTARLLDLVSGPAAGDKYVITNPPEPWSQSFLKDPSRLKIAFTTTSWADAEVDGEVQQVIRDVAAKLEHCGHEVVEASPVFSWDAMFESQVVLWSSAIAAAVNGLSQASGLTPSIDTLENTTLLTYEYGRTLSADQIFSAVHETNFLSRAVGEFFVEWDLLITPTVQQPAWPLGFFNSDDRTRDAREWAHHIFTNMSFTPLFNVTGSPAISLPLGETASGLPIGVQIASDHLREDILLQVANQLEREMPWSERIPPLHLTKLGQDT